LKSQNLLEELQNKLKAEINVSPETLDQPNEKIRQLCSKKFKSRTNLTRHIQVHNDTRNNECSICALKFKTNQTLQQPRQRLHAKNTAFDCSQCDQTYYSS
jgi:hypothetical protein